MLPLFLASNCRNLWDPWPCRVRGRAACANAMNLLNVRRKMLSRRISRLLALSLILACSKQSSLSEFNASMADCFMVPNANLKSETTETEQAEPGIRETRLQLPDLSEHAEKTFLISTTCSVQRRSDAVANLSKVCKPQIRIFERDENGARGCYFSHLSIYEEALEKGLPWALILEDNLILTQPAEQVRESMAEMISWVSQRTETSETRETGSTNWSVLHLSLVHSAASLRLRPVGPNVKILKVERTAPDWYGPVSIERAPGLGTTAYIISREAMQKILDLEKALGFRMPIDDLLAEPRCFKKLGHRIYDRKS